MIGIIIIIAFTGYLTYAIVYLLSSRPEPLEEDKFVMV